MNEKIVVIGSSNVDLIMKMERIPQIGETVTGGKFSQVFGGKGAKLAQPAIRLLIATAIRAFLCRLSIINRPFIVWWFPLGLETLLLVLDHQLGTVATASLRHQLRLLSLDFL